MRSRILTLIGFLLGIALIFSMFSAYVRPNHHDALSLFGLVFPYLYFGVLFLLPFLWRQHKMTFAILFFLVILGVKDIFLYVQPGFKVDDVPLQDLQILTFNAMMGVKLVNEKHVLSADRLDKFKDLILQAPQPDVICVQEVNDIVNRALDNLDYPFYHRMKDRGAVILSRYPIVEKGLVDFGPRLNSCLWADIDVEGQTVRIYSLHLESNRLNQSSYEFLEKEGYESLEAINGIRDLITKYPKYASERAKQALKVKAHIEKSPYPVILCGDFNDPPMSYTYNTLQKGLSDTYLKHGRGIGTTWTGAIPFLRIDYILATPILDNTSFECLKSNMSDHYPIKASFDMSNIGTKR